MSLIKRLVLRLCAGVALVFAPVAEAAAPAGIHTAQDLFDTCADTSATAQAACDAYVHATIQTGQILQAEAQGGKLTPLFCPGDNMGTQDLVAVLKVQVAAHPERRDFPAPTVIIGGGIDAYPCTRTAGVAKPAAAAAKQAAPAHAAARRPHR